MALQAIRTAPWTCGDQDDEAKDVSSGVKPMFAFVHVYKTAGSSLRDFFKSYSALCRKSWMTLISCTKVKASSLRSDANWKNCKAKEVVDGRRGRDEQLHYPTVNNTVLKESFDLYGGHFRIGTGDYIFGTGEQKSISSPPARHIVFLRDPSARYVSGVLYKQKEKETDVTMEGAVKLIKKRVLGDRKKNNYWVSSLSYLLTPDQAEVSSPSNATTHQKEVGMAIHNLLRYNAIVGMSERMPESIDILQHALLSDKFTSEGREEKVKEMFQTFARSDVRSNVSKRRGVSTEAVLDELKKDPEFVKAFEEYLKYEQMITDFAWKMHLMQHKVVKEGSPQG
ncbi:hypothetical protein ACHAWF_002444 [Thalassiosira exigua]